MNETKFDGMGKSYAKYRPTYPQAFISYLVSDVGITKAGIIADIGSGTGILTKQLLRACLVPSKVIAVEPNDDMRAVAEADLSGYENFTSINGTAENTTLASHSVDFISVAQAFHWFDRAAFKAECKRILKPNGKAILVWNSRVIGTRAVDDCDKINQKYCPNFRGFAGGMHITEEEHSCFSDFFIGGCEVKIFDNNMTFDLDGFIGRTLSASYALKEDDKNYSAYIAELVECFNRHATDGKMIVLNETRSYVGKV